MNFDEEIKMLIKELKRIKGVYAYKEQTGKCDLVLRINENVNIDDLLNKLASEYKDKLDVIKYYKNQTGWKHEYFIQCNCLIKRTGLDLEIYQLQQKLNKLKEQKKMERYKQKQINKKEKLEKELAQIKEELKNE